MLQWCVIKFLGSFIFWFMKSSRGFTKNNTGSMGVKLQAALCDLRRIFVTLEIISMQSIQQLRI